MKNFTTETELMWNVKTKVIPVNNRGNWNQLKLVQKYLSNIPGKHEVKELQKTAIMGI